VAYSLNDVYRPLRAVMRVDGVVLGLGLGLVLLVMPRAWWSEWGLYGGGSIWMGRLAGALLVAFGFTLILAAQERIVSGPVMAGMALANGLMAVVLLVAYVQQDLAGLNWFGRVMLVMIFVLCLAGAVLPLRYVWAEYQRP
jgi:hypothetical protein